MHSYEERRQPFRAACRGAPPLLDVQKRVLDEMALLVETSVIVTQHYPVLSRWDDRLYPLLLGLRDDRIAVVALVGDEMLGTEIRDELMSQATVRSGSFCRKDSDRHTMRVHGQMYLGVEPPFVIAMPSLRPRAPAACGCTLQ